jgi:hypothetical protein
MRLPWTQKAPPGPPAGSPAAALLEACDDADHAAAALGEALARRRAAISALSGVTPQAGKAAVNAMVSSGAHMRAFAKHDIGRHLGAPVVAVRHRQTFGEMARSIIDQTAVEALVKTLSTAAPDGPSGTEPELEPA